MAARLLTASVFLGLFATQAAAQEKRCIQLQISTEIQLATTDRRGQKIKQLVPAQRIAPGNEVMYTVSATNTCEQAADGARFDLPVPEHMTYIAGSAVGPGTDISYSTDGGFHYAAPEELIVTAADGTQHQAPADAYTHIRWIMRHPLKPGAVAFARFRAILK